MTESVYYSDALGFLIPTGIAHEGKYHVWIDFNIEFRCESADGSTVAKTVAFRENRYIYVPAIGDARDRTPGSP